MYENDNRPLKREKDTMDCPKTYTVLESASSCSTEYQTTVVAGNTTACSQSTGWSSTLTH